MQRWLIPWVRGPSQHVGGPYAATREFFLRGLSACYFAAFASFLLQVPGLYGPQGIDPKNNPDGMEQQCIWGMTLAALGLGGFANVWVMWGMFVTYDGLVTSGGDPFYYFQWDMLLLETGLLGIVLAPLLHSCLEPRPSSATLWMIRLVLFKLMLMSGVLKLTSGDESWHNLTAIWYHFATQCIPMPFAWWFHNLPMWTEKSFCAVCFAIEIPAAFLILVPVRQVQVFAAFLQIALQLIIIITGNYTFFNYLTIFLSCALLDADCFPKLCRPAPACSRTPGAFLAKLADGYEEVVEGPSDSEMTPLIGSTRTTSTPTTESVSDSAPATFASKVKSSMVNMMREEPLRCCGWILLVILSVVTFVFATSFGVNPSLELTISSPQLMQWTSLWVPRALMLVSVVIPAVTILDITRVIMTDDVALLQGYRTQPASRPWLRVLGLLLTMAIVALLIFRAMVCFRFLASMRYPLRDIAPSLGDPRTSVSFWGASGLWDTTMPWGLPSYGANRYGLFRAMTGIGPHKEVARPELVLEVREVTSGRWHELEFLYKPGDVNRRPPIVAPYQPRLDWQMWFQALGGGGPFFDALLQRIKEGSPAVLSLLDTNSFPNTKVDGLRVVAYSYNFTGYGHTGWWRRSLMEDGAGTGEEQLANPINLALQAAKWPHDWRWWSILRSLVLAVMIWLAPLFCSRLFSVVSKPAEARHARTD